MAYRLQFFRQPSPWWEAVAALRMQVFVAEMGVPKALELDAFDRSAVHLCMHDGCELVATLRLVHSARVTKIGRVAVAAKQRDKGLGSRLMRSAIRWCHQHGCSHLELAAQTAVIPFYEKLGFATVGSVFDDAGIPHQRMIYYG